MSRVLQNHVAIGKYDLSLLKNGDPSSVLSKLRAIATVVLAAKDADNYAMSIHPVTGEAYRLDITGENNV